MLLTFGVTILILGIFIGFLAFVYAALNMYNGRNRDSRGMFRKHISAMLFMALGGLISTSGFIIILVHIVQLYP